MAPKAPRVIRPEEEDRRTDSPASTDGQVNGPPPKRRDQRAAKEAGVESLPDGEEEAAREAALSRDD
ncbi:hypothetical protein [Dongia sp.]|uniref:hypothetical protein n=1 Tax=Dongia sp. TaxID=1977262 RepID=UPI0037531328